MNSKRYVGGLWWRSLSVAVACGLVLFSTEGSARAQYWGDPFTWIGSVQDAGGNAPKDSLGWQVWGVVQAIGSGSDQLNAAFGWGIISDGASARGAAVGSGAAEAGFIGFVTDSSMGPTPTESLGVRYAAGDTVGNDAQPVSYGASENNSADPVRDGELVVQETDFQMAGPGVPYRFFRTYRNRVIHVGVLGYGWDHNYNRRIVTTPNSCGDVDLMTGDSGRVRFTVGTQAQGVIRFVAPPGVPLQLEEEIDTTNTANNVFVLREGFGVTSTFDHTGLLTSVRDAVGHQTIVQWEQPYTYNCPQHTFSADGTCETVAPFGADVFYRVKSVTDAGQRTVYYNYKGNFLQCIGPLANNCTTAYATFNVDPNSKSPSFGELLSVVDSNGMGNSYEYHHEQVTSTYLPDALADAFCASTCGSATDCHNVAACEQLENQCVSTFNAFPTHNPPIDIAQVCAMTYLSRVCNVTASHGKFLNPYCNGSTGDHSCATDFCLTGNETEWSSADISAAQSAFCNEKCFAEQQCTEDPQVNCPSLIKFFIPFCTGPSTCYSTCRARYQPKDAQGNAYSVFGRPEDLSHNLMNIRQLPSGRLVQANTYETDNTDPSFDKVLTQQLGDGQIDAQQTNTITFSYFDLSLREWHKTTAVSLFGLTTVIQQLPTTIKRLGDRIFLMLLGKASGPAFAFVDGIAMKAPAPGSWSPNVFASAQYVDDMSDFKPLDICPARCTKLATIPTETPGGIAQSFTRLRTPPAPFASSDWLVLTRTGSVTAQLGLSPMGGATAFPRATWTLSRGFSHVTVTSLGNGQFLFSGPPKTVNNVFDYSGRAVIDWTEGTPKAGPASEFARERELEWVGTRDRKATSAYEAYEPFSIVLQRATETTAKAAGHAQRQLKSFPITTDAGTVVLRPIDRLGHYTFDASGPAVELLFGTANRAAALHLLTNNSLWIGSDPAAALGDQYQPLLPLLPDYWNTVFPGPTESCVRWSYSPATVTTLASDGTQFPVHAVVVQDLHGVVRTEYYDALGRVLREVNNHVTDGKPKEITDYNYDPASGAMHAVQYASGQRSCIESDSLGQPLQRSQLPTSGAPGNASPIVETFAFSHGQMTDYVLDPSSATPYTVHVDYDFWTRLPSKITSRVDANQSDAVTFGYDPPPSTNLSPRTITDASGAVTQLDNYDPIGPSRITFDAFGTDPLALNVLHDQFGRVYSRQRVNHQYATKANIDTAGLIRSSTLVPDSAFAAAVTQYTYQGIKQPASITRPNSGMAFSYDAQGRPVWMVETGELAAARTTYFDYGADGRLDAVWLPDGALRVYWYDEAARVTQIQEGYPSMLPGWATACAQSLATAGYAAPRAPKEKQPAADFQPMRFFTYDAAGRLLDDVDGTGTGYVFTVDGFGRTIDTEDSQFNHYRVGYDSRGRVAWEAVYGGNPPPYDKPSAPGASLQSMVEYQYDNLDRVVARSRWNFIGAQQVNPAQLAITTTYAYDDANNVVSVSEDGHRRCPRGCWNFVTAEVASLLLHGSGVVNRAVEDAIVFSQS